MSTGSTLVLSDSWRTVTVEGIDILLGAEYLLSSDLWASMGGECGE